MTIGVLGCFGSPRSSLIGLLVELKVGPILGRWLEDHLALGAGRALVAEPGNRSPKTPRARLGLSKAEAAESLGCSVDFLEEHVLPELRVVRRGRRVFVAVAELERWLERSAALTLEGMT